MQSSARVERRKPRDRGELRGLMGRVAVSIRACSRGLNDPVDSYLHVGSGVVRLVVDAEGLRRQVAAARDRRGLEKLVESLASTLQLDYAQFALVGGKLAIPGSSVKGNVRSRIELSFREKDGVVRSCLIRSTDHPLTPPERGREGWRHFRVWQETLAFDRGKPCDFTSEEGEMAGVCLVCDIFGTSGLLGLVEFSDFVGEDVSPVRVDLPTGEKLLAAPPGSAFRGWLSFRNLEAWELGLLLFGMGVRDSRRGRPVLLGKSKYRVQGKNVFGVVRYVVESLRLSPLSQELQAEGVAVKPGGGVDGDALDRVASGLVSLARSELGDELLDIDEVARLEQLEARV